MEEPDFDDLINDDFEDAYDAPQEYEEYMEEMMAEANEPTGVTTSTETEVASSSARVPDRQSGPNMDLEESFVLESSSFVRSSFENRDDKRTDAYSFERYNRIASWREEKKVDSPGRRTMQAREWKTSSPTKNNAAEMNENNDPLGGIPSAPDSQLLHFLNQPRNKSRGKLRNLSNLPVTPASGKKSYPLTLSDGQRVFLHCRARESLEQQATLKYSAQSASPLGLSMSDLMRNVEITQRRREHAKRFEKATPEVHSDTVDHRLWVDKHAPLTFSHLLSEERTNREVIRALRAWDPFVFNTEPPPRPVNVFPGTNNENVNETPEKAAPNKNDCRPEETERVILLSGPPGVGKSTLANIAAHHCGYRPIEVNGSDERSASSLKERVVRSMESNTLNLSGKKSKPTCLILDEIDGADASGAIKSLVEIIRADIPPKGGKKKSKATYLKRPIIFICNNKFAPALKALLPYCTHFNVAPPSPNRLITRLRGVLALEKLSLVAGSSLLNQLVTASGGDIRSCLYTLQFASAKAKEWAHRSAKSVELGKSGIVDISKALQSSLLGDGLKDSRNDIMQTITSVFRKIKKVRNTGFSSRYVVARSDESSSDSVLDLVASSGEGSRILDCIFLNIPRISFIDPTFDRYASALELLSGSDIYRSMTTSAAQNNSSDLFSMQSKYLPCGAASVHILCRVEQRQDLTFTTRELHEGRFNMEANQALSQRFVEAISPKVRAIRCPSLVALETSPFVLWILSAGEGSITLDRVASSLKLLSPKELTAFEDHVSILRSLGLTYKAIEQFSGNKWEHRSSTQVDAVLDPPLERFIHFDFFSYPKDRKIIPTAMKGLLAQSAAHETISHTSTTAQPVSKTQKQSVSSNAGSTEISSEQAESMDVETKKDEAKSEPSTTTSPSNKRAMQDLLKSGASPIPKRKKKSEASSNNFLLAQAERAKAVKTARKRARAGIERSANKKQTSYTGSNVPLKHVIRLRYVKGFTQAVRVPCKQGDIL